MRALTFFAATACFMCGLAVASSASAADLTEPLPLAAGETLHIGKITVTAAGGFRGYRKGADREGETYAFVRDGAGQGEYAMIVLDWGDASDKAFQRSPATREALAYVSMASRAQDLVKQGWTVADSLEPERKWTYSDTDFFYVTLDGHDKNAGNKLVLAGATVGVDHINLMLQSPASMWQATLEALRQFAAAVVADRR